MSTVPAVPDQVTAEEDREVEGAEAGGVVEDVRGAEGVLQPHLPLSLLGERLLGPYHEQVRHVLDVVREKELGEVAGRHLAVHVPGAHEDADGSVRELTLQLLAAEERGGAHAAHQVGPLPGLADLQGVGQVVTAVCKQKQFIASKVQAFNALHGARGN